MKEDYMSRINGKNKKRTPEEKEAIIIDYLNGTGIMEIERKYNISDSSFYKWKKQYYCFRPLSSHIVVSLSTVFHHQTNSATLPLKKHFYPSVAIPSPRFPMRVFHDSPYEDVRQFL